MILTQSYKLLIRPVLITRPATTSRILIIRKVTFCLSSSARNFSIEKTNYRQDKVKNFRTLFNEIEKLLESVHLIPRMLTRLFFNKKKKEIKNF